MSRGNRSRKLDIIVGQFLALLLWLLLPESEHVPLVRQTLRGELPDLLQVPLAPSQDLSEPSSHKIVLLV